MHGRVEHRTGTSCLSLGTSGLLLVLPEHQHLWMGMEALPLQEEPLGTELSTGPSSNFFLFGNKSEKDHQESQL